MRVSPGTIRLGGPVQEPHYETMAVGLSRFELFPFLMEPVMQLIHLIGQDIRGAGITGSADRDWAPNTAFEFSAKGFDSKPQDGFDRFDLKRMAREKVSQNQGVKNQSFELEQHQNQSKLHQRQLLEEQIAENAARKEVICTVQLVFFL
jgi:hypothetical protein